MAGQGIVGPVLPLYARDFGVSTAMVGLTFTAFGLARLLLNIPAGLWADRRGRRFLLVGGPLVTAIGMFGSAMAGTIWVLLAFRFVAGVGSAFYMTGAQIYLIDIAGEGQRARYIATNQGALLSGVTFGPAIGGLAAEAYGLRAPFYLVGTAAAATAVYSWFRLPETKGAAERAREKTTGIFGEDGRAFFTSRKFVAIGLVTLSIFSIRGSRQSLVPLHANGEFGFGAGEIGLIFTGLGLVGLLLIAPAGWAADQFDRRLTIIPAGLFAAVGVVFAGFAPTATLFVGALLFSSIGTGASGPAPAAFVADLAPSEIRGSALGAYRTWGDLGIVLSPPLSGLLADQTAMSWAIAANGVLLAAAVAWFGLATARD